MLPAIISYDTNGRPLNILHTIYNNMIVLFGIPNCDTVKKTQKWLDAHKVSYTFHNYKLEGIDSKTLQNWCVQTDWERIMNKKSTTWRGLSDADKAAVTDATSAIPVMQEHTSLIKRPVITQNGTVKVVGYDENALEALLS